MELAELLTKMNGVESYGLYFKALSGAEGYSPKESIPECGIKDVVKYLDYEVKEFKLGIFDNADNTKYIRACIYLYY